MTESGPQCKYGVNCLRPPYQDKEWCIFHLPKLSAEDKKKLTAEEAEAYAELEREFKKELYALIRQVYSDTKAKRFDFRGFQFVDIDLSDNKLDEIMGDWQGFQKPVLFSMCCFKSDAFFLGTTFQDKAYFIETRFYELADFTGTTFNKEAYFAHATFKGKLQFSMATFKGDAFFNETCFEAEADFSNNKFQLVNFKKARFQQVDFSEANFQKADFFNASFQQANFKKAIFQNADFLFASFKWADFSRASFQQANFTKASFQQAYFTTAIFQETCFIDATFKLEANFDYASIKQQIIFRGSKENEVFENLLSFQEVSLEPEARVVFEKVNLRQAGFLGTNLENFEFRDVVWFSKGHRKIALWDEFREIDEITGVKIDLAKLADNYHQLVLYYEKKREFDTALEFRIGEMEVIRKQKATSKNKIRHWLQLNVLNLHAWYKYLSYYGTSYWRAFAALGIMLLLSAGVFMLFGFGHAVQAPGNSGTIINYDISLRDPASFFKLFKDFLSALGFSFSILTLQRTPYYEAIGPWSNFLTGLARLVFYSQAALLLLAIRRRFKQ